MKTAPAPRQPYGATYLCHSLCHPAQLMQYWAIHPTSAPLRLAATPISSGQPQSCSPRVLLLPCCCWSACSNGCVVIPCLVFFWILPMAPFWTGWFQSSTFPCFCCELYLSHCQLYLSVCCSWVNPFQLKSLICCKLKYLRKYLLNSIHDHACLCQTEVFGMEYNYNLNFEVNLSNSEDKLIALIIHTVKGEKSQNNLDPTKLHKV